MLKVEIFGDAAAMADVARRLDGFDGVSRVTVVEALRSGDVVVSGSVRPTSADALLQELESLGVPSSGVTLSRLEVVGQIASPGETSMVWAEVLAAAWHNARPIGRYLAFMFAAGVVACYGV